MRQQLLLSTRLLWSPKSETYALFFSGNIRLQAQRVALINTIDFCRVDYMFWAAQIVSTKPCLIHKLVEIHPASCSICLSARSFQSAPLQVDLINSRRLNWSQQCEWKKIVTNCLHAPFMRQDLTRMSPVDPYAYLGIRSQIFWKCHVKSALNFLVVSPDLIVTSLVFTA